MLITRAVKNEERSSNASGMLFAQFIGVTLGMSEEKEKSEDEVPECQTETAEVRAGDRKNDDVIGTCVAQKDDAITLEVQIVKGELGLGFCIEGGKGSAAGDRPIYVKRRFLGAIFYIFYRAMH